MLVSFITRIVHFSIRRPWLVMALALVVTVASGYYAATNFAINTDINKLISPNLDWRQRDLAFERDFPGSHGTTLVVLEAPTVEQATLAANALTERLQGQAALFKSVRSRSVTSRLVTWCST
jgi:predicted RND superfamily exporter protein